MTEQGPNSRGEAVPNRTQAARGALLDVALVAAPLAAPIVDKVSDAVIDHISNRPPNAEPPQVILPPGVDPN